MAVACLIGCLLAASVVASPAGYNEIVAPNEWGNTVIAWTVLDSPDVAFALWWSGTGAWLAGQGSEMIFNVTGVEEDIEGVLTLGNMTWSANDTFIAMDLALSVWGITPWLPGLVVAVGETNLDELNATAYEAAARVSGNFLNGTMTSSYETVTASETAYDCLVFEYEQDPPVFGEPQIMYLAYDTVTGVLVMANTSFSFGTPYILTLELDSIVIPLPPINGFQVWGVLVGVGIIVIGLVIVLRRR
ncbi:MAG: hypothetical protein ACFFD9_09370 [Candidatus Thorarchaeota archaeon]